MHAHALGPLRALARTLGVGVIVDVFVGASSSPEVVLDGHGGAIRPLGHDVDNPGPPLAGHARAAKQWTHRVTVDIGCERARCERLVEESDGLGRLGAPRPGA